MGTWKTPASRKRPSQASSSLRTRVRATAPGPVTRASTSAASLSICVSRLMASSCSARRAASSWWGPFGSASR